LSVKKGSGCHNVIINDERGSMQPAHSRTSHTVNGISLPLYLLVSFGCAWLIWLPLLIAEYLQLSLPVPSVVFITLGSFAPSVVALLLTWRYAGGTELRQLLARALVWRVSPIWYLLAIFGPALMMLLAMGGHIVLGGTVPDYVPFGPRWLIVAVNIVLVFFIGGPLGEEFGWRGVVLRHLRHGLAHHGRALFWVSSGRCGICRSFSFRLRLSIVCLFGSLLC